MTDEDLYRMSDEELEAAFRAAKAEMDSPGVGTEETDNLDQEVNLDDGTEQPSEASDHNSEEEEVVKLDDAEDDTSSDVSLDGGTEEGEEAKVEGSEAVESETQPAQKFKFKANGQEYEFDSNEIVQQFPKVFGQAMDYTRKMQAIKPWRKTIDAIEQAQLGHEDVSLMIDVLKGDKDAISAVLKRTDIDILDLDVENSKYVAKDYGRDDTTLALKDVVEKISRDPEYQITQEVLGKRWDETSWREMSTKPEMIEGLHVDIRDGVYGKVQSIADKMKVYDGAKKSDLEYYLEAGKIYYAEKAREEASLTKREEVQQQQTKVAEVKQKEIQRVATKEASAKRKAAAPTKSVAGKRTGVVDYLNASEEEFEEWYKTNVTDKM